MIINNNQLIVEFNEENIYKDFDIVRITKDEGYFRGLSILDNPDIGFHAEAAYYAGSKIIYVLFKKGVVDKEKLKAILQKEDEAICVNVIDIKQSLNSNSSKNERIYRQQLAQLLINSLGKARNENWSYNNISGELCYWNQKWKKQNRNRETYALWMIKIELTNRLYVKLQVKTFSTLERLGGKSNKTRYCFDDRSMKFRRLLKGECIDDTKIYVNKSSTPNKHNTVSFINFKNYDEYMASKMGVMSLFLNDVDKYLSHYMSISLGSIKDYQEVALPDETFTMGRDSYGEKLNDKGVTIIDLVNSHQSQVTIDFIKVQLAQHYGVTDITEAREPQIDTYNIRVIRNRDYYKENEIDDPYKDEIKGYVIQHVTTDDFAIGKDEKPSAAITKIVQELLIKDDIKNQRISLVNWQQLNYDEEWTFVNRKVTWSYNTQQEKSEKHSIYYRMKIAIDGCFQFDTYNPEELTLDHEWIQLKSIYDEYDQKSSYFERQVEGIVYQDISRPNIILETERFTIPKIAPILEALTLSRAEQMMPVEELIDYLKEYKGINPLHQKEVDDVVRNLEVEEDESISYKIILSFINIRSKFGKDFNSYVYQKYGRLFHPRLKQGAVVENLFNAVLNIKYFYEAEKENKKLYYFVGLQNGDVKTSLANSCKIREVSSLDGNIDFTSLMQLMAVEFVRNNQYTVLPFPFKYLREWMDISWREKSVN